MKVAVRYIICVGLLMGIAAVRAESVAKSGGATTPSSGVKACAEALRWLRSSTLRNDALEKSAYPLVANDNSIVVFDGDGSGNPMVYQKEQMIYVHDGKCAPVISQKLDEFVAKRIVLETKNTKADPKSCSSGDFKTCFAEHMESCKSMGPVTSTAISNFLATKK